MSTLTYIKNFIKDRNVASITPTSAFGINRLAEKMDFSSARVVVEFGPGTGIITRYLLDHLPANSKLILIELNENFVDILRRTFRDPRVVVCHDDVRNVKQILQSQGVSRASYILSGIPFSWLPDKHRDDLVRQSYEVLEPGGKFLAYQTFWQADEHLQNHLRRYFYKVGSEFVILNAPPLRVYEAQKNGVDIRSQNAA